MPPYHKDPLICSVGRSNTIVNFCYSSSYSKMPSGQCSSKRLDDPFRLTARDDKMWAREVEWAQHHHMTRMRCPCNCRKGQVSLACHSSWAFDIEW